MLWQFILGRSLQVAASVGAVLTLADWVRFGGADVRVGRIVIGSAVAGAAAAAVALWQGRRHRRPR